MLIGRIARNENRYGSEGGNTRAEGISVQWHDLFLVHREALAMVASMLVEGPCSPAIILFNAEYRIKDSAIPQELRYANAVRMVVLTALTMPSLDLCAEGMELFPYRPIELAAFEVRIAALAFRERCAVFLRDVLGYSRRQTALLLNTDDSHVEDLLFFARKRLGLQGAACFDTVKLYFAKGGRLRSVWTTGEALLGCA